MPWNARRSLGGNATISETDTSRTSTTTMTISAIRRRRKLRLLCRSENWMAVLRRATGKPAGSVFIFNDNLHHLRNGGDLGVLERIPEIRRECRQYTHKCCTYSAVQPDHKHGTHRTRLARGSSHTNCSVIFVRLKRVCHLVRTCLTFCCWLTCLAPRAHLLPHSPRHQNTHHNRHNTIYSKNTQCIINLSKQSWSIASLSRRTHSGVKTCRVTETCATPSLQFQPSRTRAHLGVSLCSRDSQSYRRCSCSLNQLGNLDDEIDVLAARVSGSSGRISLPRTIVRQLIAARMSPAPSSKGKL